VSRDTVWRGGHAGPLEETRVREPLLKVYDEYKPQFLFPNVVVYPSVPFWCQWPAKSHCPCLTSFNNKFDKIPCIPLNTHVRFENTQPCLNRFDWFEKLSNRFFRDSEKKFDFLQSFQIFLARTRFCWDITSVRLWGVHKQSTDWRLVGVPFSIHSSNSLGCIVSMYVWRDVCDT